MTFDQWWASLGFRCESDAMCYEWAKTAWHRSMQNAAKIARECHDFGPDTKDPQRAYFLGLEDARDKILKEIPDEFK